MNTEKIYKLLKSKNQCDVLLAKELLLELDNKTLVQFFRQHRTHLTFTDNTTYSISLNCEIDDMEYYQYIKKGRHYLALTDDKIYLDTEKKMKVCTNGNYKFVYGKDI